MADLDALRRVSVFSVLSDEQLGALAEVGQETRHAEGDVLTEEGAVGHRFHLILDGAAVVERGGDEVAAIGSGDFVGEIGLLGGGHSTATVRCTAPTRCFQLRREAFWETLERQPEIALRILEVVCRRIERELTHSRRQHARRRLMGAATSRTSCRPPGTCPAGPRA
ncbi:MAG: Crp/Fnr family transcriptional regulator [Actinomycetota bacterium]